MGVDNLTTTELTKKIILCSLFKKRRRDRDEDNLERSVMFFLLGYLASCSKSPVARVGNIPNSIPPKIVKEVKPVEVVRPDRVSDLSEEKESVTAPDQLRQSQNLFGMQLVAYHRRSEEQTRQIYILSSQIKKARKNKDVAQEKSLISSRESISLERDDTDSTIREVEQELDQILILRASQNLGTVPTKVEDKS
jgi:hypothetical protein